MWNWLAKVLVKAAAWCVGHPDKVVGVVTAVVDEVKKKKAKT